MADHHEPAVKRSTPMPKDYVFVPKGNVYITANCRKQTRAAHQIVYAVFDKNRNAVGLRVPSAVHSSVLASEASTRQDRASAVQKRDDALEREFREATKKLFPKAPAADIPRIVARAMKKGSGRVGRTSKIEVEGKANLAVAAHIRHCHTDYDKLLKQGIQRGKARAETFKKVGDVLRAWRGSVDAKKNNKTAAAKEKKIPRPQKKVEKYTQPVRSGQNPKTGLGPSKSPPPPKERRTRKLRTRCTRATTTVASPVLSGNCSVGRSLRDDLLDIEESDEYVDTSDSFERPGIGEEDSD